MLTATFLAVLFVPLFFVVVVRLFRSEKSAAPAQVALATPAAVEE
jgi:hypothetical protein